MAAADWLALYFIARSTVESSFCMVIGFSKKSSAPILVASTAVSMLPWPLIITTGMVSWPLVAHSLSRVIPSLSGIQMSNKTMAGRVWLRSLRASPAFSAKATV